MIDNLIWFIILSLLAEIVGTVSGFGSSLLFVPIAGFFLDFHSVLGITALFHLASNLSKITLFRKGIDKQLIINIGIPSIIFVALGAYFSKFLDSTILEIVLAIFLIVMSLTLFIFKNLVLKPTRSNSIAGGALSGAVAGLLGTGGAIRGLTLAAFDLEMNSFIATSAIIDLGIDLTRSVVYTANGFVHVHDLYLVAILIVVGFVGTFVGKKILALFSQAQFKKVLLILIFVIGVITMVKQLV
ncbi:MAG: sulfite exporter TauE/SafE family protein [Bacteroidia bacterium]|nr:sulfite exporter TauE/SafE family protein [Sphingobacteriaceae bacterium]MBP9070064.1 sulfite exporter TauE/SafE family protein [Bacteroidia bacterium]